MNAIEVHGLTKKYQLYDRPFDRLREMIQRRPFHREFWALKGVDFTLARGHALGLVGVNGSGKSTILQIVAGTLQPTTGSVKVSGRVSALLELGSGFNPEFTGRENVYLNGAILGISRKEMERRFEEIVAFADIGSFIEQPVKTYSTGMYMRLAFAVAINVDPEILIIDEALAVGDMAFQMRCFKRIRQAREEGVTILLVSHDLDAIKNLCDEALLVSEGLSLNQGATDVIAKQYTELLMTARDPDLVERQVDRRPPGRHGNLAAELTTVHLETARGIVSQVGGEGAKVASGETMEVVARLRARAPIADAIVGIAIRNRVGLNVFGTNTELARTPVPPLAEGQNVEIRFGLNCHLVAAPYSITVAIHSDRVSYDWADEALLFEVMGTPSGVGIANLEPRITISEPSLVGI